MKTRIEMQSPPENQVFKDRPIRTFLADDDPFMLAMVGRLLAKDSRVTIIGSATDGRKAFHCAATLRADLVLTDLHMPIMDGIEVTRWLKKLPNPPIVFVVTSDDSAEALTKSLGAGADAFLAKTADLPIQLQMALQCSFPANREQNEQPPSLSYELVTATN